MKYAIVESGGKQYKAVEDGTIEVDRLPVEIGANVKLEQVLLLADGESFTIGTPVVKDTPVWTKVVAHFKGPKVVIFNYRPKKRIRVKTGHRQNYTRLLVEQIGGATLQPRKEPVKVEVEAEETPKAEPKEKKPAISSPKGKVSPIKAEAKKATKAGPAKKVPAKVETTSSPKGKKPAKAAPAKAVTTSSPKGKKPAKDTPKPAAKKTATKKSSAK